MRRIDPLERNRKLLKFVKQLLDQYREDGKTLEDFEEDYGCMILFDECNLHGFTGLEAIWFKNPSSRTVFSLLENDKWMTEDL